MSDLRETQPSTQLRVQVALIELNGKQRAGSGKGDVVRSLFPDRSTVSSSCRSGLSFRSGVNAHVIGSIRVCNARGRVSNVHSSSLFHTGPELWSAACAPRP